MTLDVAVVGAGAAGLAAAIELAGAGRDVEVYEAETEPGGVVRSVRESGYLIEEGPNSILADEGLWEILDGLDLSGRALLAPRAARRRFVLKNGNLLAIPMSPPALALSGLLGASGKLRLLAEPFARRRREDMDESVASFVCRRFGRAALEELFDPFVSGVYAGDPERLSAPAAFPRLVEWERRSGSVVRGALAAVLSAKKGGPRRPKGILSFPGGLGELAATMAARLGPRLVLGSPIEGIEPGRDGGFRLFLAGGKTRESRALVLAAPAPAVAALAKGLGAPPDLAAIPYAPVASVFLGYARDAVAHPLDGFGYLAPSREGRPVLGILFSSTLFAGRAPEGHIALTAFVGGVRRPELAELPDDELFALVAAEARTFLGARGDPVFRRVRRWRAAIPQYELGHLKRMAAILSWEASRPGLALAGSWRSGISVAQTLASGRDAARRIA